MTTPTRQQERTGEQLTLQYLTAGNEWAAAWTFAMAWPQAELEVKRRAKRLRAEGFTVREYRWTPEA